MEGTTHANKACETGLWTISDQGRYRTWVEGPPLTYTEMQPPEDGILITLAAYSLHALLMNRRFIFSTSNYIFIFYKPLREWIFTQAPTYVVECFWEDVPKISTTKTQTNLGWLGAWF